MVSPANLLVALCLVLAFAIRSMASPANLLVAFFLVLAFAIRSSSAKLSTNFYGSHGPGVSAAVRAQGCDGSILLNDTATFTGEKNTAPNRNSARGFEVSDATKAAGCPGVVSCADVLAISARDSVAVLGGPSWNVKDGRRDARTSSQAAANTSIPAPTFGLNHLISSFQAQGLSGAHTIGQARCTTFRDSIYNETNIDGFFATTRQASAPGHQAQGTTTWHRLIYRYLHVSTIPTSRTLSVRGDSDQQLFNGGSTDSLVMSYSKSSSTFNADFVAAMIRMGDIKPLTGFNGEIRKNCRRVN